MDDNGGISQQTNAAAHSQEIRAVVVARDCPGVQTETSRFGRP